MTTDVEKPIQTMIFLNGSKQSFRCECGCNVFTKVEPNKYRCNSCRVVYVGT